MSLDPSGMDKEFWISAFAVIVSLVCLAVRLFPRRSNLDGVLLLWRSIINRLKKGKKNKRVNSFFLRPANPRAASRIPPIEPRRKCAGSNSETVEASQLVRDSETSPVLAPEKIAPKSMKKKHKGAPPKKIRFDPAFLLTMKTSSETESQKKIKDKGDSSMTLQDILTGLCSLTLSEEEVSSVLAILMEKNPLALADQNRELKEKREEMTCMGDQQVAMERELGLKCKELQNLQMKFIQMRESLESQLTILQLENTILKEAVHHHVGPDGEQTPVKEDVPAPAAHEDSAYHV